MDLTIPRLTVFTTMDYAEGKDSPLVLNSALTPAVPIPVYGIGVEFVIPSTGERKWAGVVVARAEGVEGVAAALQRLASTLLSGDFITGVEPRAGREQGASEIAGFEEYIATFHPYRLPARARAPAPAQS